MHRGKTFTLFCLSPGALSYVITAYRNDDCPGQSKRANVRDNTCRDTNIFGGEKYGGSHQKATLLKNNGCGTAVSTRYAWWADGGDGSFKKGAFLKFDRDIHAYGFVSS
ncbi:hypothetical protein N7537_000851 [Penicillium hordei]|uniref:Uncharacterized protein n=1 Tax=Penicillium hordei TaxID=40994 RepID=A0AAD6H7Q6_9EURO|nr:uncharacterized protein N7537_000851 [Penicillium hordei]KAJ5615737.1 hypothetical protein N7537_000851 [Penicillium hordei]